MTFTPAALAIDGARTPASLQRLGTRASVKQSGIINVGDLKVKQLSSVGNGVRIMAGGGVLENRYVSNSGQTYVVENVDELIVNASNAVNWPATNPGVARSHLVCVSIGDPQYSTAGHGWMTDANKPANPTAALDYQYVRPFIIPNVPAGTTRVEDLASPPPFPCYALARLDLPSSWTTIADAQIIDLRKVVNARQETVQWNVQIAVDDLLNPTGNFVYEAWPDNSAKVVYVPEWATKVYINAWVFGALKSGTGTLNANFRVAITGGSAAAFTNLFRSSADRYNILMGAPMTLADAERGVNKTFAIWGTVADITTMNNVLKTDVHSSCMVELRFTEEAV